MQTCCNSSSHFDVGSPSESEPGAGLRRRALGLLSLPLRLISRVIVLLLLALIRGYQLAVSPLLRPCCRFVPSCSEYARLALKKRGLIRGLAMTIWRLARCQPFCRGGYDAP